MSILKDIVHDTDIIQLTFICSKATMKTLKKGVKYAQKLATLPLYQDKLFVRIIHR